MKEYDRVKLISNSKKFLDIGLKPGHEGIVLGGERNGYYLVYFDGKIFEENGVFKTTEIDVAVTENEVEIID